MNHDVFADLSVEFHSAAFHDEGVEAARNACVAGAPIAAAAITAAAYYDNPLTGVQALVACMQQLVEVPESLDDWLAGAARQRACEGANDGLDPVLSAPGFGHIGLEQSGCVRRACARLVQRCDCAAAAPRCRAYLQHRRALSAQGAALNPAGLVALALMDHGVGVDEAERWFLLWRMSAAMQAAQKTRREGLASFPFLTDSLIYEGAMPEPRRLEIDELMKQVGLDV